MWETEACHCKTELVWDGEQHATVVTEGGSTTALEQGAGWQPERLLAIAADASLLWTFLASARASGIEVLGYVSSARVSREAGGGVSLALAPCILVSGEEAGERAARLLEQALAQSPVCRTLRQTPMLDAEIVEAATA